MSKRNLLVPLSNTDQELFGESLFFLESLGCKNILVLKSFKYTGNAVEYLNKYVGHLTSREKGDTCKMYCLVSDREEKKIFIIWDGIAPYDINNYSRETFGKVFAGSHSVRLTLIEKINSTLRKINDGEKS